MYAIDITPLLRDTAAKLHSLPFVLRFAILIFATWLASDSTRVIVQAIRSKWLRPRAAAVWTIGMAAIGYHFGGASLALFASLSAMSGLIASVSVRKFLKRLEFYRYVKEQMAKQKN
ncbi:hypothetical protein AB4Y36_22235 [Paraburkholderia sp. BR10936]|uniref:hypothetical protein n=1 Tax=Paraburkholderia sp. BR10936 TaxID=3236993 RepID=UPI0034D30336